MNYALILFDVDGTLVECASGETFRKTADDWKFLLGRVEKCKELREQGIHLALITNQAGVAFPWSSFTAQQIKREIFLTGQSLGIPEEHNYICFSSPNPKALPEFFNASDSRRKPGPGMLQEAMRDTGVLPQSTLMVGDRPEDEAAALAAGVNFMWAKDFFGDEK